MDANDVVTIKFTNVKWPKLSLPNHLEKEVRCEFLIDQNGVLFGYNDLKDILAAYLHDEYNVVPLDFDFDIAFVGK